MAYWLSHPQHVPVGTAYQLQDEEEGVAALVTVTLEIVSHKTLAEEQNKWSGIALYLQGKCNPALQIKTIEFSPGVSLVCDISDGKRSRPIVPPAMRDIIMKMLHCLNHPGQKATLNKVQERYHWDSVREDVFGFVKQCHTCQAVKMGKSI